MVVVYQTGATRNEEMLLKFKPNIVELDNGIGILYFEEKAATVD
jgi:hypothetical protein